ncbi:MAG: YbhB/YbcL family Raf kinase inhibitor-like protein [Chlamydiota bacterium]
MKVTSDMFNHNGFVPRKYTCHGSDINPPLTIKGVPEKTQSLALIVDDPDAPMGTWVHWVVYDISPKEDIAEDSVPGKQGVNNFHKYEYGGPCPPSGTHRFFFKVYALDKMLGLEEGISKEELLKAMEGHIIDQDELIGLYQA